MLDLLFELSAASQKLGAEVAADASSDEFRGVEELGKALLYARVIDLIKSSHPPEVMVDPLTWVVDF